MFELGNVANSLSGDSVSNPGRRVVSRSARLPGQAAVAAIEEPPGAQEARRRFDAGELQSMSQIMKEMAAAIRAKLENFRELIESITAGRFSASMLSENLTEQAEQIESSEVSPTCVYSDVSSLLSYFREAVKEIRSFEGFLIGVHDKIEKFLPQAEFDLNQVQNVEDHMANMTARLELGIFSLAHVREEALKALRGQHSSEPQRAFARLEDNVHESNANAEQALAGQTQSEEIDLMV